MAAFSDLEAPVIGDLDTEGKRLFSVGDLARILERPGWDTNFTEMRARRWNRQKLVWTSGSRAWGDKGKVQHLFAAHDIGATAILGCMADSGIERPSAYAAASLACYAHPSSEEATPLPPIGEALAATLRGEPTVFMLTTMRSPEGATQYIGDIRNLAAAPSSIGKQIDKLVRGGWESPSVWTLELTGELQHVLAGIKRLERMRAMH